MEATGVSSSDKVVYDKPDIFIRTEQDGGGGISGGRGNLRIIEACYGVVIQWVPNGPSSGDHCANNGDSGSSDCGWALVDTTAGTVNFETDKKPASALSELKTGASLHPIMCELVDLKSYKLSPASESRPYVTLLQKDGTTHPTFHFHNGGINGFLETLWKYIQVKQSDKEPGLFLIIDPKVEALQRSLHELHLYNDHTEDNVSKFFRNPYVATFSTFSKVTSMVTDYLIHGSSASTRPDNEMLEILPISLRNLEINQDEPGFEVISCAELGSRPEVSRGPPLTPEQWQNHFDAEGRLIAFEDLKEIIFRGGVQHSIRNEVWKFLLNFYEVDSTTKSRAETRKKKIDDYFRMKLQWKSITPDQEKRFSDLRDRRSLVEKDVNRTDRADPFYSGENNENVTLLHDILMTYCMYNFDLGYVQGMSDLLSPILVVMLNEVDAFWCFAGFMELVCRNFEMDQKGMKEQLTNLRTLLTFLDPELIAYLESRDSDKLYFCFRWLLIIFKSEFKFQDTMRFWEVLWTQYPCKNFHLLFCLAVLDAEKHTLIENNYGFTEILKHMNDLSLQIPLDSTLCKAEAIYCQIKDSKNSPSVIREILGLPPQQQQQVETVLESDNKTEAEDSSLEGLLLDRNCDTAMSLNYY